MAGGVNKLNTVLDQITETGERSDALFSHSIQDLYQTVLASSISEAALTSQLLVDMLDRNLYERANDCRWWALSAQLRRGLAQPSAGQNAAMADVLRYINSLYTVYARLFVYDRSGVIVASTGDQQALGQSINADTLARVCALRSELDHYAEPFAPSPLYGGEATFTYHAAIRHPSKAPPSSAASASCSTPGRNCSTCCSAAWPDAITCAPTSSRRKAACCPAPTPPARRATCCNWAAACTATAPRILQHDGQYVIAACTRASGYREFRAADGVEQPVIAVLLQAFGPVRHDLPARASVRIERLRDSGRLRDLLRRPHADGAARGADPEAVPFAKVQRTASAGHPARIGMLDVPLAGGRQHFVWVFDLARWPPARRAWSATTAR
jgi:hypothetical protein